MGGDLRPRPEFLARPPEGIMEPQWAIRRVPADKKMTVVILSHNLVGCYTHFFRGCTVSCPSHGHCEACENGTPRRWHSWFGGWNPKNDFRAIVEITPRVIEAFDSAFRKERTLRGKEVTLHRAPAKPNGKLYASIVDAGVSKDVLPKAPDVAKHLMRMWGYTVDMSPMKIFESETQMKMKREGGAT